MFYTYVLYSSVVLIWMLKSYLDETKVSMYIGDVYI